MADDSRRPGVARHAALARVTARGACGAAAVAGIFSGRALGAQPALVDGTVGVVWAPGGKPRVVWDFTISHGKIARIDMIAAADSLGEVDLVIFDD